VTVYKLVLSAFFLTILLLLGQVTQIPVTSGSAPASSVPTGAILMVNTGSCPAGYAEVAGMSGRTLVGTIAASANVGTTGGVDTITPAGSVDAPVFTGSAATSSADSGGTPSGTVSAPTFTGNLASLTHSGAAVAAHPAHTHAYTEVLNHTHTVTVTDPGHTHTQTVNSATTGGSSGYAPDTSTNTGVASGYTTQSRTTGITAATANPAGGVASGTTGGPDAALTHSVTQPDAHAYTPGGSVSQPTFTGSALGTHQHTLTATGTIAAPAFTGTQFDNRSAFMRVIFCIKT
jgi:hypothetical protein